MRLSTSFIALAVAGLFATATQAQTLIGGGKTAQSFPIVISQSGSYKLAADLVVPAGVDGIVVSADHVTLDLNGFSITGAGLCTGGYAQITCTGTKTGISGQKRNLTVRNGRVAGFAWGVVIQNGGVAEDLAVEYNASVGLAVNYFGIARGIRTYFNAVGIDARNSLVRDSSIAYSTVGLTAMAGLIHSVHITSAVTGLNSLSTGTALRETSIAYTTLAINGSFASMGNNLCNNVSC